MSSLGQAVGGVAGAVVGFFTPLGPLYGAQIGMMVGGYIDPPKGPNLQGPRLDDLKVQTSTYGAIIPRLYGTMVVTGNVFWLEGNALKEHTSKKKVGGKGGGSKQSATTYSYSATFAVGLCKGPIAGIRRLWIANQLVYDAESADVDTIIASNQNAKGWRIFTGADPQAPEPRMQADVGAANCSGYPGLAYIVFYDLDLSAKYSNSLMGAQVKAEVVVAGASVQNVTVATQTFNPAPSQSVPSPHMAMRIGDYFYTVLAYHNYYYPVVERIQVRRIEPGVSDTIVIDAPVTGGPSLAPWVLRTCQADQLCCFLLTANDNYTPTEAWLYSVDAAGVAHKSVYDLSALPLADYVVAYVDGGLWMGSTAGTPILLVGSGSVQAATASNYSVTEIGVSASYVWTVEGGSPYALRRFDRTTLAVVDAFNLPGAAAQLHVVSDSLAYVLIGGVVYRYSSGTLTLVASMFGTVAADGWMWIDQDSPAQGYLLESQTGKRLVLAHQVTPDSGVALSTVVQSECLQAPQLAGGDLDVSGLAAKTVRGYRITRVASIRSGLEPLQAAWPFDVIQSGYQVKFKPRGGVSVASVAESDLGTVAGGDKTATALTVSREMDSQIAAKLTVKYLAFARAYDDGAQTAERHNTASVNERVVELPLSLSDDEAMQMADVLLKKDWIERVEVGPISLPPTWRALEPSDVITVSHRGAVYEVRLTRVEYQADGRVTCHGKLSSAAAYTSAATGAASSVSGAVTVPLKGSTALVLVDAPAIDSSHDSYGLRAAIHGWKNAWPGGVVVRSDDGGQSYDTIAAVTDNDEIYQASTVLGSGRTDVTDTSSAVIVKADTPGADLFSITLAQQLAGGNLCAFGADGRWEVLSFRTVIDNGDGTRTLRDFFRGLYGTEWACGTHTATDRLVPLATTVPFLTLPTTAWQSPRLWRSVTAGDSIDYEIDTAQTYVAENLKPLAPCYLKGSINKASGDWSLEWLRRTRLGGEWQNGIDAPLSEASESYEVEIWDVTYTTLKRTLTGLTSTAATYTAAQQTADFGSVQTTIYVRVYQLSARVGRGRPLQQSITSVTASTTETWSTTLVDASITLSGGNLTATRPSGGTWKSVVGSDTRSAGKWYWEIAVTAGNTQDYIGVLSNPILSDTATYFPGVSRGYGYGNGGLKCAGASAVAYGASYTAGDTISVLLDLDSGTLTFWKNGTSQGVAYTGLPAGNYAPALSLYGTGNAATANFGATAFAYTPPAGYGTLTQ